MTESVNLGLAASQGLELVGYASQGNDSDCRKYLIAHANLSMYQDCFVTGVANGESLSLRKNGVRGVLKGYYARHFLPKVAIPDVDVCHSPFYPLPELVLRRHDLPKVQTIYDLIPILSPHFFDFGEDQLVRRVIDRLSLETYVICISESTKRDLCNFTNKVDPARIFVIHPAAVKAFCPCTNSAELSRVRNKYAIPENAKYLLSVCTLEPRKNVEQTIRSFVELLLEQHIPDLYLVLTGTKGWKYETIFSGIEHAATLKDKIKLTGFVPDEDLAPLYSGALAFVYPSLYEGFGLPPLEAMQSGTPVITSNTSSLPEVVGDAGIMVDPLDGDALSQAMLTIYRDGALREELAKKSQERARLFSWEKCVKETIEVYKIAAGS